MEDVAKGKMSGERRWPWLTLHLHYTVDGVDWQRRRRTRRSRHLGDDTQLRVLEAVEQELAGGVDVVGHSFQTLTQHPVPFPHLSNVNAEILTPKPVETRTRADSIHGGHHSVQHSLL